MNRLTIIRSEDGKRVYAEFQPGNGTRYVAFGVKIPGDTPNYGGKWLVGFPELGGGCWYFDEGSTVDYSYVSEKYPRRYFTEGPSAVDASEMAKVITYIVPNSNAWVLTDDTGTYLGETASPRKFTPTVE